MKLQPLTRRFQNFLAGRPLAPATRKNYISDVQQFLTRLAQLLQEEAILPAHLTAKVFDDYGRWLNDPKNSINPATARRYLSSLKCFGQWLAGSGLADADPAAGLDRQAIDPTAGQLVNDFKNELMRQKLSPATVKNYVSDVNNYLIWANKHLKLTDNNSIKL